MKNAIIIGIVATSILMVGCDKKSSSGSTTPPPGSKSVAVSDGSNTWYVGGVTISGTNVPATRGSGVRLSEATQVAIRSAISRARDNQTIVVIEEPKSKKFLQFGHKDLWVDLPCQTLSAEELSRAERAMGRFGIPKETHPAPILDDSTMLMTSFQKCLGDDIELAVHVAEAVFREVYLFPSDVQLQFTRIE